MYPTQKCHDGTEKMLDCPDGYDLIVCSGGDGTLDEVVSGIRLRGYKAPLGIHTGGDHQRLCQPVSASPKR